MCACCDDDAYARKLDFLHYYDPGNYIALDRPVMKRKRRAHWWPPERRRGERFLLESLSQKGSGREAGWALHAVAPYAFDPRGKPFADYSYLKQMTICQSVDTEEVIFVPDPDLEADRDYEMSEDGYLGDHSSEIEGWNSPRVATQQSSDTEISDSSRDMYKCYDSDVAQLSERAADCMDAGGDFVMASTEDDIVPQSSSTTASPSVYAWDELYDVTPQVEQPIRHRRAQQDATQHQRGDSTPAARQRKRTTTSELYGFSSDIWPGLQTAVDRSRSDHVHAATQSQSGPSRPTAPRRKRTTTPELYGNTPEFHRPSPTWSSLIRSYSGEGKCKAKPRQRSQSTLASSTATPESARSFSRLPTPGQLVTQHNSFQIDNQGQSFFVATDLASGEEYKVYRRNVDDGVSGRRS